jgi:uncharacterized membrane protein
MFESVALAAQPQRQIMKVGLMEFPSKGIWSLVYITGEPTGELAAVAPGGEKDNLIVWMPTGFMPPTGFVCVVPRRDVMPLTMSAEDAAKLVMTAGIVNPDVFPTTASSRRMAAEAARATEAARAAGQLITKPRV